MATRKSPLVNRISWLSSKSGLTDARLAARAGITRAHLNRIKNGRVIPRADVALAIAQGLGLRIKAVFALRKP
jgi:putative transcriptional regulator